jgi:glucose/arabinose dehydrogenase
LHNSVGSVLAAALWGAMASALVSTAAAAATFDSEHYRLKAVTVAAGLEHPWGLAFLPDGRMLVTERPGRLRIVGNDGALSPPLDGVPAVAAGGQGGLLDVVLDPAFATNRRIYLTFSEPGPDGAGTAALRARLNRTETGIEEVRVIFRQRPKSNGGRHFGSRLVFARDGSLFITTGDRGQRGWVQDFTVNRGQVIRINPDGSIPVDNPFVGRAGFRPEVWSLGHRNPQGAALHPVTGELWTVEHGARGGDEINKPEAGKNYGWPVIAYGQHYSGGQIGVGHEKPGLAQPLHFWDPSIAPSGLAFYHGDRFPKWRGNLLVGALKYQLVVRLTMTGDTITGEERILGGLEERIRDVRFGPDGYLYLLTDSDEGRVLRIEPVQ